MPQKITTDRGRREATMSYFRLTARYLTHLREVGPKEARWQIEHEYREQVAWARERRDWLLAEFTQIEMPRGSVLARALNGKPKPAKAAKKVAKAAMTNGHVEKPQKVRLHGTHLRSGQRIG